jgi:CDP-diacylglycerol--glycerol-3-phosphate 3-phosphatidyltransferase
MNSIPTLLTYFRIILIPVFVLVFFLPFDWVNVVTTAIFGLAAITDWLDGYLARRLEQTSRFGAFLDPVADKLIVGVALVLLVQANPTFWMTVASAVIIGREITISALREWMAMIGERAKVKVNNLGKWKTTAQMTALFMLLYHEPLLGIPMYDLGMFFLYIAVVLTLWSMVLYLKAAWPVLSKEEE